MNVTGFGQESVYTSIVSQLELWMLEPWQKGEENSVTERSLQDRKLFPERGNNVHISLQMEKLYLT